MIEALFILGAVFASVSSVSVDTCEFITVDWIVLHQVQSGWISFEHNGIVIDKMIMLMDNSTPKDIITGIATSEQIPNCEPVRYG